MQASARTFPPLALDGGPPAVRARPPHFRWPHVDSKTAEAVVAQLFESVSIYDRSGIVATVEDRLRDATDVRHALLTNSGTSAIHSMLVGCDLGPGDEVVCPAYTFYASVTPLLFTGAIPVFADSGPDGNVDPEAVEAAVTPRTKAIVVTHMWGYPCRMDALAVIAERHGLSLLEDTSHAFGATYAGRPVGSFGRAAAQSLQGQKPHTGGEGGVLLTDDSEVFYRALALGHYNRRCRDEIPPDHRLAPFAVTGMGLKLRIHPLAAAIANEQLDRVPGVLARRTEIAGWMAAELGKLSGVDPVLPVEGATASWYALILRLGDGVPGGASVDDVHEALLAEGAVEVDRPGSTRPLPRFPLFRRPGDVFPAYAGISGPEPEEFPEAEAFHASILKLPVWDLPEDRPIVEQYLEAFRKVWAALGARRRA